jgi:hypothetical protein
LYLPDETLEEDIEFVAREMCSCEFDYLNVPLLVEVTAGRNWHVQEEVGKYSSVNYGIPAPF